MNQKFTEEQCKFLKTIITKLDCLVKYNEKASETIKHDYNFYKSWYVRMCDVPPDLRSGSGGVFSDKNATDFCKDFLNIK